MVVWSTIEASCPICKNRLRLREVGSGFAMGQDSDLFVRMKGKHIIQAEIHTCHQCRYSGYTEDFFREVSTDERLSFLMNVAPQLLDEDEQVPVERMPAATSSTKLDPKKAAPKSATGSKASAKTNAKTNAKAEESRKRLKTAKKGLAKRRRRAHQERRVELKVPLTPCQRTPMPHVQYYWAAKAAEVLGFRAHAQAQRILRAYWCLRIAPTSKLPDRVLKRLRKRYLTEAIRKFRQDLRYQKDPHVVYLVAELCRRNGNFLLATSYFRRFFEKSKKTTRRYLRQAAEKLYLVAKEKLATEISMEEVLYNPAPEPEEEG